jgi:hypothetical protein
MKRRLLPLVLIGILAGCSGEKPDQTVNRDTLTQRQKDSILANSRIPGASSVKRAMTVADSASRRALQADSQARDTTDQ